MSHIEKDNASEIGTGNASGSSDYGATGVDRTMNFEELREVLPPSEGDYLEMSPNKIFEKCMDYINSKMRQNAEEIIKMERTNEEMEKLIKSFENALAQGDSSALNRITADISRLLGSSE